MSKSQLNNKHGQKYLPSDMQKAYDNSGSVIKASRILGCHPRTIYCAVERGDVKIKKKPEPHEILKYGKHLHSTRIRRIITSNNFVRYTCGSCGNNGTWMKNKLSLQLHHIDGDRKNNEVKNLVFLCPNCHSQTPNYAGKSHQWNKNKMSLKPNGEAPVCKTG